MGRSRKQFKDRKRAAMYTTHSGEESGQATTEALWRCWKPETNCQHMCGRLASMSELMTKKKKKNYDNRMELGRDTVVAGKMKTAIPWQQSARPRFATSKLPCQNYTRKNAVRVKQTNSVHFKKRVSNNKHNDTFHHPLPVSFLLTKHLWC